MKNNLETYTTAKGNTLEVLREGGAKYGTPIYTFTLRERARGIIDGENITVLLKAPLYSPAFFTEKFIKEN